MMAQGSNRAQALTGLHASPHAAARSEAKGHQLKEPAVSIIVVTYNSAHCLIRALAAAPPGAELIVVDNASSDDTVEQARAVAHKVIANTRNLGFGAACNQGVQVAVGDFLLFLNPDAVLASNTLQLLLAAAADRPDAVAFGPRFTRSDAGTADGKDRDGAQVDREHADGAPPGNVARAGNREVSFISGASLLCRRSAFSDVGGFDERFFLYFEDQDLCLRLAERGPLIEVGEAIVFHHPGQGARLDTRQRFAKYRHYGHSRAYFCRKHGERFAFGLSALEQAGKGLKAVTLAEFERAAQHFGRAVGYVEGGFIRPRLGGRT
jgi:N-acetylglucosaminyl-diphospho-decaprenol L-rhamnosyltransferase